MAPIWRENQLVWIVDPKNELKWRELMILKNPKNMQARVQGKVQLKDPICFKWVQIGS
jgi:hypothetical protein